MSSGQIISMLLTLGGLLYFILGMINPHKVLARRRVTVLVFSVLLLFVGTTWYAFVKPKDKPAVAEDAATPVEKPANAATEKSQQPY